MNIGRLIKEKRISKKISQSKLSELTGIPRVSLGRYERSDRSPNIDILQKISNALDININEFLGMNSDYDRATSLADTYFNSIMKLSEDKSFNEIETICIREHFFDLLLRYKMLINSLSDTKYTWNNKRDSSIETYNNNKNLPVSDNDIKELILNRELEKEINTLVNWMKSFPNWITRREIELSSKDKGDNNGN